MQIVGYRTAAGTDDAALFLAGEGTVERVALTPGADLAYTLTSRRCAGTLDGNEDGHGHEPCDSETAPYCSAHTSRWACARCTGACDLPLATCREEHVVYLAAFAPATFKVGVTRSWRLRTRLREQGADRGAHLRTVSDGRTARQIEADIATEVGDSVRVRRKIEGLHRAVDAAAWTDLLAAHEVLDRISLSYGLDLAERPVAETLATGTVRGTKGRILVLEHAGSTYAVDLRDLVGYRVRPEPTERRLQTSLGAF